MALFFSGPFSRVTSFYKNEGDNEGKDKYGDSDGDISDKLIAIVEIH